MNNVFRASWLLLAALMLGLAGCASSGTGQKTGEYVDDSWITTKVKSQLIAESDTKARNITVDTDEGVVTLGGTAESWAEVNKAVDIARNTKGVKSVRNDIRIEYGDSAER
jgi:osmotically-inducible protein OsmY